MGGDPVKRDSVIVLATRGAVSALVTWKALLLALGFNLLLAYAFAHPVNAALRQALDRSPWAARLAAPSAPLFEFYGEISRARPDVFGDLSAWDAIATGVDAGPGGRRSPLSGFLSTTGVASSAAGFAVLAAALSALLAGGFAGRFGSEKERASLPAFGADAARFALPSLLLGALFRTEEFTGPFLRPCPLCPRFKTRPSCASSSRRATRAPKSSTPSTASGETASRRGPSSSSSQSWARVEICFALRRIVWWCKKDA